MIIESAGPFTAEETAALICGIFGLEMYNFDPERDMLISISQSEEDEGEEEERERDRVNVIVLPMCIFRQRCVNLIFTNVICGILVFNCPAMMWILGAINLTFRPIKSPVRDDVFEW